MVAGSECRSGINFKGHATMTPAFAVMGAVQKKPPGNNGRQALQ